MFGLERSVTTGYSNEIVQSNAWREDKNPPRPPD